jgi:hypothetical protein
LRKGKKMINLGAQAPPSGQASVPDGINHFG